MGRLNAARLKASGLAFGIVSSIAFGTSGPFGKALINAGYSPLQASWTRVAGAALVLVPLALLLRGRAAGRAVRRRWPLLLLYGLMGVAGCQSLYFFAASRLPVGVAILLEFTGPVLVVAWLRFVQGRQVPRTASIGVGIALVGLACVVEVWSGLSIDLLGLLAGLGAAACQAAYFLIIDRVGDEVDPLVMTAAGSTVGAVALAVAAPPWGIPWHVLTTGVPLGERLAPGWLLALWIILISTVTAYLTGVAAVHRLSAPVAGAVAYVEAVSAGLFAWMALGERLSRAQLVGGAIVLVGAFVAQRSVAPDEPVMEPVPSLEGAGVRSADG
ncbi:DMT family transporter [Actinoallomurus purpureus]|uniref:EamA family transporter n=1 Tax=Actinoallomurus purpureus TaxID=478114 RepID=UPI0020933128|nr:DMT family transporter [Actinoallomurus purpureus]MCO6003902.1 DMT family transporter [Actinoallomurus purpureus]